MFSLKSLLCLLLGSCYSVYSQIVIQNYDVTNAVPFNGSNLTSNGMGCELFVGVLECDDAISKLDDGATGPVDSVFDNLTSFFAFSRQSGQTGRLDFIFPNILPDTSSLRVVLHFFNSPSDSISLPSLSVTDGSTPVPFTFDKNSDLSQADSTIRNITLIMPISQIFVSIYVNFENDSRIDWFLISEVDFFNNSVTPSLDFITFEGSSPSVISLGPDKVQSNVSLSCTVVNSGSFEWIWEYSGSQLSTGDCYQIWTADATRTSVLEISGLRYSDSGNYSCRVRREGDSTFHNEAHRLKLNATVAVDPTSISFIIGSNVSLKCEAYGYLSGDIEWSRNGQNITAQGRYSLTMTGGSIDSIDGSGNPVESQINTLTITNIQQSDVGVYVCSSSTEIVKVELYVAEIPSTIKTTITTTVTTPPSSTVTTTTTATTTTITTSSSSTLSILPSLSSGAVATSPPQQSSSFSSSVSQVDSSVVQPTSSTAVSTSKDSSIPTIIGSAAVILIVVVLINVIVLVIIFIARRKHASSKSSSSIISKAVVQPDMEPFYNVIDCGQKPEKYIITPYLETDILSEGSSGSIRVMSTASSPPMYQEIPDTRPRGSLLKHPKGVDPSLLQENPMYSSLENLVDNPVNSSFNIYAEANVPPSIPEYHGTPQNSIYNGSVYSIDLNPLHFKSEEELYREDTVSPYLQPCHSIYSDPQPILKNDILEVSENHISEIKELGIGQFGRVILAHTIGVSLKDLKLSNDDSNVSVLVAVKRLQEDADDRDRQAFEKEIKFMARLRHENVIRLLGICLERNAFLMMEYMENGDLNQYLQKFEFAPETGTPKYSGYLGIAVLIYMCLQIAAGMRYLSSLSFVHRDLAARNCLVGQKSVIKIADFGMSRKLYDNNYYRIQGKAFLPIRWMSCECFYGRFSEKTDVWAYGVTMWEVFNFCKVQPYDELSDQEIIDNAIRGVDTILPEQPHTCPEEVYQVMLKCWAPDPKERASFEDIHGYLSQIHAYCDM